MVVPTQSIDMASSSLSAESPKALSLPSAQSSSRLLRWVHISIQIVMIGLYFGCFRAPADDYEFDTKEYIIFRDIMAMLLLGFGFLMTFLKQYGLSAVGFTMMLTVLTMQMNIPVESLCRYLYHGPEEFPHPISMISFIDAEFAAATVLISFGALIGRVTPLQMTFLALLETICYTYNKVVFVFGYIGTEDVGGSITIHMFGAYFGLAVSYALGKPKEQRANAPDKISDVLALIGTTILWVYWPSFVGATETATPENEMNCVSNTIIALLASTAASFFLSHWLSSSTGKLDPVHIANSTLAGGVAIGSSARLAMGPGGAAAIGIVAGLVSVVGYQWTTPFLERKLGLSDTCGVGNLHGMPSIVGALASVIFVATNADAEFLPYSTKSHIGRQFLGAGVTLVVSVTTGYFTGLLLGCLPGSDTSGSNYQDVIWWQQEYNQEPEKDDTEEEYDYEEAERGGEAS